jgi:translation initiation factor 2B subunit (eIF-2B alpha/beta/delta family)/8-oxo-dGTP pyrophosphatase MutT (NUDIX family)
VCVCVCVCVNTCKKQAQKKNRSDITEMRKVVTSFIQDPNTNKVLLGLRSTKVHTYQHCWAGISGSIESNDASPYLCACREIKEETQLEVGKHLRFIRSGRPLLVTSSKEQYKTSFLVFPFLFHSKMEDENTLLKVAIKKDWEHERLEFFDPKVFYDEKMCFVPNLKETFERIVLPDKEIENRLRFIRDNKTDGAAQITEYVLENILSYYLNQDWNITAEDLKNIAWHLYNVRPTMAPIGNASIHSIASALKEMEALHSSQFSKKIVQQHVDRVLRELKSSTNLITKHVEQMINEKYKSSDLTVLTLSYSSTIVQVLKHCAKHIKKLIVSESRPACEGLTTIEKVSCDFSESTIILCTEAALPSLVLSGKDRIDLIVIGADSILYDGSVINKTGSCLLALLAKEANIPMFVLCDKLKIRAEKQEVELEHGEPEDLLNSDKQHTKLNKLNILEVYNPIFETVPFQLLQYNLNMFTEQGLCTLDVITGLSREYQQEYDYLFFPWTLSDNSS